MGYYVRWLVSWGNGAPDELRPLAEAALAALSPDADRCARWCLEQVHAGRGYFPGPKGHFWAIGRVSNHAYGPSLAQTLLPFIVAMWKANDDNGDGLPHDERVVLFVEAEETHRPEIYQIQYPDCIRRFETEEWYWGQA